jgi:hypothetical protein
MTRYYQSDVTTLSDEEIRVLMDEIQATGILDGDEYSLADFMPEDSWERQASTRWSELCIEQHHRYDLAHPEEVERRKKLGSAMGQLLASMAELEIDSLFSNSGVFGKCKLDNLRTSGVVCDGGVSIQEPIMYGNDSPWKVPRDS